MPNEKKGRPLPGTMDEYKQDKEREVREQERRDQQNELATLSKCLAGLFSLPKEWIGDHPATDVGDQLLVGMSTVLTKMGYTKEAGKVLGRSKEEGLRKALKEQAKKFGFEEDSTLSGVQECLSHLRKVKAIPTSQDFCPHDLSIDLFPYWESVDKACRFPGEYDNDRFRYLAEQLARLIAAATLAYEAVQAKSEK